MSSPFRSPDHLRSTPRSSPSRQHPSDSRFGGQTNGFHRSYREGPPQRESPSRPLWEELERLYVSEENKFRQSLDAQDAEQERLHKQQLREALELHEAVRQSAERARERLELEIKRENQRREEEEKRAVEEARRRLAEQEEAAHRRQIEEIKQREEERKRREALHQEKEEQERQIAARRLREEQEKAQREAARQQEEAERKSRERMIAKEQVQVQNPEPLSVHQSQPHQPNSTSTAAPNVVSVPTGLSSKVPGGTAQGLVTTTSEREAVHKRYVALHRRLKVMRKSVVDDCKRQGFKKLGDWRREIRVNCGQLNKLNKDANRNNTAKVRKILNDAKQIAEPSIDIAEYMILAHDKAPGSVEGASTRYPGVLFYLLNILAKSAISQLISETGIDTETGDALGVLICSIFSVPDFRWNEQSLIDIFWAKYHVVCPPLFGIFGSESNEAGKSRLGWWIDRDYNEDGEKLPTGTRVSDDMHYQRMTGLGVGFSAVTLRDFSKSRNRNPTPNRLWWESMARLLNTPANEVQSTHCVLLKALIEESMPRIMSIYGGAGKALVRRAIVDFPKIGPKTQPKVGELPRPKPAVVALESMKLTVQQRYGIKL
ncbi:hypothetical protein M433DRAFT_4525 [Acidomyces richmondensis BFW]|nr:MAG: hypothetical protein FE78DRAFT_70925 [Acidomyces sp. 'richmondensis']KYG45525.1 hypothetical protein M433DRAFT_4525 [Acidomyces richmondensis BFW]